MSEVAVKNIVEALPYKVKDIGSSEDGRNSISISEKEMPGLMATRAKYGPDKPLKGKKITARSVNKFLDKAYKHGLIEWFLDQKEIDGYKNAIFSGLTSCSCLKSVSLVGLLCLSLDIFDIIPIDILE